MTRPAAVLNNLNAGQRHGHVVTVSRLHAGDKGMERYLHSLVGSFHPRTGTHVQDPAGFGLRRLPPVNLGFPARWS